MRRLLGAALFLALGTLVPLAAGAEQILHAAPGVPSVVVGPSLAERMDVTVRGVTRMSGRSIPVAASALGRAATAVALPDDLRPDEPIVVRITPPSAGTARLMPADSTIDDAVAAARASGIMLGILLVTVLLLLVTFAITREPSIPGYVALATMFAVIELFRNGALPIGHAAPAATLLVLDLIATAAGATFIATYLRLWTEARDLFWAVAVTCGVTIAIGLAGALSPQFTPVVDVFRPMLLVLYGVVVSIVVVIRARNFPPAWILFGGESLLFLSIAYQVVRTHVGTPFLDRWAFEVGASVDALVFSTAIIVRIRYAVLERRAIERRLNQVTHEASHDELTGALNRRGLFARSGEFKRGTLFAIDLDGFKSINDLYGHDAGNGVLVDVVAALRDTASHDEVIARVGGDEFVVVAPQIDLHHAQDRADAFAMAIEPIRPKGVRTRVERWGASIGYVALDGLQFDHALRLADTHAYRVKSRKSSAVR